MSRRFINCSACKGCHTGRGSQYCTFVKQASLKVDTAGTEMASAEVDPAIPDRNSDEYEVYLARKIVEEEERLRRLQDKTRIAEMETQLAKLRLQTANLDSSLPGSSASTPPPEAGQGTGIASAVLAASQPGAPGGQADGVRAGTAFQPFRQRSKEEKEILSCEQSRIYLKLSLSRRSHIGISFVPCQK